MLQNSEVDAENLKTEVTKQLQRRVVNGNVAPAAWNLVYAMREQGFLNLTSSQDAFGYLVNRSLVELLIRYSGPHPENYDTVLFKQRVEEENCRLIKQGKVPIIGFGELSEQALLSLIEQHTINGYRELSNFVFLEENKEFFWQLCYMTWYIKHMVSNI